MTGVPVRQLVDRSEFSGIVAVAARAFWSDPLFDFLAGGDLLEEYRILPHVFGAAMKDLRAPTAQMFVVDSPEGPRGFAGWLGPGTFPRSRVDRHRRDLRAAAVLGRLHHRRAAAALLREVERRHPADDHWYLALLATDPTRQGRGLGTALLGPILGRCDAEGQPAYTETQKEDNVAWYARSGFALIDEVHVRGTPTIWRLWRDPKPTADGERPGSTG